MPCAVGAHCVHCFVALGTGGWEAKHRHHSSVSAGFVACGVLCCCGHLHYVLHYGWWEAWLRPHSSVSAGVEACGVGARIVRCCVDAAGACTMCCAVAGGEHGTDLTAA
jgi:hypothetical protein